MPRIRLKLLSTIDGRFRRARPGSVLIIVIVLLLLLAILGAAYISTTRAGRVSSAQNVLSTNIDVMLDGIAKVCDGVIMDDLNDTFGDLRGNSAYTANTTIINHNFYQGQGLYTGGTPNAAPNADPTGSPVPASYSYNLGDIVNDPANPFNFYYAYAASAPAGTPLVQLTTANSLTPYSSTTPTVLGWLPLFGHLPLTAIGFDPWLAERIPDAAGAGNPQWQFLTQSVQFITNPNTKVTAAFAMSILGTPFEDPTTAAAPNLTNPLVGGSPSALTPLIPTYKTLFNGTNIPALQYGGGAAFAAGDADGDGIADSIFFRIPGVSTGGLTWYAAVRIIDNNSAINVNTAWSRDHDYTFTYTGSPPTSVTVNNSTGNPPPYNSWCLNQTSVGLQELINAGDTNTTDTAINPAPNLDAINNYRFDDTSKLPTTPTASWDPFDESSISNGGTANYPPYAFDRGTPTPKTPQSPVTAKPTFSTNDYNFLSEGEAFYQQFIRRMANPGYNTYAGLTPPAVPPALPTATRYQAIPLSDEAAIAYHFCLQNPNINAQSPVSLLESLLPQSLTLGGALQSTPYDPSQTTTVWFPNNFDYPPNADNITGQTSLRPLLVTHNPVSNYIQHVYNNYLSNQPSISDPILAQYMHPYGANTTSGSNTGPHFKGAWSTNPTQAYALNDVVIYPNPTANPGYTGPSYTFVCVAVPGAQPPLTGALNPNNVFTAAQVNAAYWQLEPYVSNPVKADVNTATFRELFRAYWSVMAGNPSNATPFGFTQDDAIGIYDATYTNPQMMFRSPLRDPITPTPSKASMLDIPAANNGGGGVTTNTNAMVLRAALAAVNTLGLRDNSQNVISKTIVLPNPAQIDLNGSVKNYAVAAEVFSNAPNPVISEVFADSYEGADNENSAITNPQGYVAIELYNPYSVPLTLVNWQLALVNRSTAGNPQYPNLYPDLTFQTSPNSGAQTVSVIGSTSGQMQAVNNPLNPTVALPAGVIVIPAHGYALLENYNAATNATPTQYDAIGRPTSANFPSANQIGIWWGPGGQAAPNTCDVYVPNLQLVIYGTQGASITGNSTGGELVLLRPRLANGTPSTSSDPQNTFTEVAVGSASANNPLYPGLLSQAYPNLYDMVPVDSFDFTNLKVDPNNPKTLGYAWSYIRIKGGVGVGGKPSTANTWFMATFPGFYSEANANGPEAGTSGITIRQAANSDPPFPNVVGTSAIPVFGTDTAIASYQNFFPPVQVYNVSVGNTTHGDSMHFPNAVVSPQDPGGVNAVGTPNMFPFGGFARNGDILDVPFIGAYRIRAINNAGTTYIDPVNNGQAFPVGTTNFPFLEMNALPKDCSFAAVDTTVPALNAAENVGRFFPMSSSYEYVSAFQTTKFPPPYQTVAFVLPLPDYYAWARNLFNYVTVQSSSSAYLPHFDPNLASSSYAAQTFAYPPANNSATPPTPTLTANGAAADQTNQDSVGVEGLININTASWKVLSMLPFVPITATETQAQAAAADRQIAQAIVNYRIQRGPFTSIFDLNQVPGFQNGGLGLGTVPPAPTSAMGLLSPADPGFETANPSTTATGVGEDYQWDCLTLSRISNLVTTRSDTFTIYIVVQGWQNVGVTNTNGQSLAQPVVTRRYAYIVDRSAINGDPNSRFLKTLVVPND